MGKYDPLRDYLASQTASEVRLTFAEVERLVGRLPDSARVHRAWWANDSKVEALAWREAGWHVSAVNQTAEVVIFARGAVGGSPRGKQVVLSERGSYVDPQVVSAIKAQAGRGQYDYAKLLRLIEELNDNYRRGNAYASLALLRAILDHVPPIFRCTDFSAVANTYPWDRTDKAYMRRLLSFRSQANDVMHRQISGKPDLLGMDDIPPRALLNRLLQECAG